MLSPLDSRYSKYTSGLVKYFSEDALNQKRVEIEIQWFEQLLQSKLVGAKLGTSDKKFLNHIYESFGKQEIKQLAKIEAVTVHDVKAVEYFIRQKIAKSKFNKYAELIHFGLTSEDINNLCYACLTKDAVQKVIIPAIDNVKELLTKLSQTAAVPMLAKTHGQPASPTILRKELQVFIKRIKRIEQAIKTTKFTGKLNGATGTFGAMDVATKTLNIKFDWPKISKQFIEKTLGLKADNLSTQIDAHDWDVELFYKMSHLNGVLHNLCTDIWLYIMNKYFIQENKKGAVGSSTMPHKINPINFENAEGNLEMSNAVFGGLASSLVTTRLQRDLTDSTVQRNIGVAFGYFMVAIGNLETGLKKIKVNKAQIKSDLANSYEVLAEPIQSVLRLLSATGKQKVSDPYKLLKEATRGKAITEVEFTAIIDKLIKDKVIGQKLKTLSPQKYTGVY